MVYVNGELKPTDEATVSVFDHGLLYGDGVFDTMFATYGYIFKLREHLERFRRSLRATRLTLADPRGRIWTDVIIETVAANGLRDAYIKVVATRGVAPEPLLDPRNTTPTLIVFARPYLSLAGAGKKRDRPLDEADGDPAGRPRGAGPAREEPQLPEPRAGQVRGDQRQRRRGAAARRGRASSARRPATTCSSCATASVITPERGDPGGDHPRDGAGDLRRARHPDRGSGAIAPFDLFVADEVFLTSTAAGLVPVTKVDGALIGDGRPGPCFRRIDAAYDEMQRSGRHGTPIPGAA